MKSKTQSGPKKNKNSDLVNSPTNSEENNIIESTDNAFPTQKNAKCTSLLHNNCRMFSMVNPNYATFVSIDDTKVDNEMPVPVNQINELAEKLLHQHSLFSIPGIGAEKLESHREFTKMWSSTCDVYGNVVASGSEKVLFAQKKSSLTNMMASLISVSHISSSLSLDERRNQMKRETAENTKQSEGAIVSDFTNVWQTQQNNDQLDRNNPDTKHLSTVTIQVTSNLELATEQFLSNFSEKDIIDRDNFKKALNAIYQFEADVGAHKNNEEDTTKNNGVREEWDTRTLLEIMLSGTKNIFTQKEPDRPQEGDN
ncbi:hypothetical protein RFI_07699 [Reticulomyxa filosa]|uniref:Uncharacterized protein n=1 Tax=Reticulomyxa filosa TaxID=46433 RepID=X6NU21_RETFI|nr:hypothetical protein RFI_07699 [Reticulomyxa filosa]|eukprot:ETO29418.1 hypothetical protein RFI_07699 [Reticulomyxa filosa]